MESINQSHPYVPRDLNLPDFIPGVLTQSTILGVYLSCSLLVVSLIWIVSGRFLKISKIDRLLMCWWAFTGLTHIILEGYFAFSPQFYTEKTACYLAEVWKEYSKGDSRYAGRDAGVVTVEAITAVLEGPASLLTVTTTMTLEDVLVIGGFSILSKPVTSFLTTELVESEEKLIQSYKKVSRTKSHKTDHARWLNHFIGSDDDLGHATFLSLWLSRYAIANKTSYRYILQIAISLGQLYGTAVYFITSYLEGDNFAASTYYYYIYYVFANSFWVWIPTLIVIRSWKKICAAFETEFKDEKTKTC